MSLRKNLKKYLGVGILISLLAIFFPLTALALEYTNKVDWTVSADQTITDDVLATAGEAQVKGTLQEGLTFLGNQLTFSGLIEKDIWAVANNIDLNGQVNGSVWAGGSKIVISGNIDNNVIVVGATIKVASSAMIKKDLILVGGQVEYYGNSEGGVKIFAGTAKVGGKIAGDLYINATQISLFATSQVAGNFSYKSDQPAKINTGAKIDGKTKYIARGEVAKKVSILSKFLMGLAYLLIAFILIWFLPDLSRKIRDLISEKFWVSLGVGVVIMIFSPILIILLAATRVGLPLAVLAGISFGMLLYIGKVYAGLWLGHKILSAVEKKAPNMIWATLIGVALILIVSYIPIIGQIIAFVAIALGFGGILLRIKDTIRPSIKG